MSTVTGQDQTRPHAAAAVWQGFLSAGRLHPPMLFAMKASFLETADRYSELGGLGGNYTAMLASLGLQQDDRVEAAELRKALEAIGDEGLAQTAKALTRGLDAADDRREAYFQHRVVPFFSDVWPRTKDAVSPGVAEALAELCIVADERFPEVLDLVRHWLIPVAYPYGLIHQLRETTLCERFPKAASQFLDKVVGENAQWLPKDLAGFFQISRDCIDLSRRVSGLIPVSYAPTPTQNMPKSRRGYLKAQSLSKKPAKRHQ